LIEFSNLNDLNVLEAKKKQSEGTMIRIYYVIYFSGLKQDWGKNVSVFLSIIIMIFSKGRWTTLPLWIIYDQVPGWLDF